MAVCFADSELLAGPVPLEFDSVLNLGFGFWTAPALPRLPGPESSRVFDFAAYSPAASGMHLAMETQLVFPLGVLWFPLGLSARWQHLITESGSLSFTRSADERQERPQFGLSLTTGVRTEFAVWGIDVLPSLEVYLRRMRFLNASSVGLGPLVSLSLETKRLRPEIGLSGIRPVLSLGVELCPYLALSGDDKRGSLDGSGLPRGSVASVRLADQSAAVYFSVQVEAGMAWADPLWRRDHQALIGWSGQFVEYQGLLERVEQNAVSTLDVTEDLQTFYLSLRSNFL